MQVICQLYLQLLLVSLQFGGCQNYLKFTTKCKNSYTFLDFSVLYLSSLNNFYKNKVLQTNLSSNLTSFNSAMIFICIYNLTRKSILYAYLNKPLALT